MSDRISSVTSSNLLANKLDVLLNTFNDDLANTPISEQEILVSKLNATLSLFYKTLTNPLFSLGYLVRTGNLVNYKDLNEMFNTVGQDLAILYKEINSLETNIMENFNHLAAYGDQIKSHLKMIRSKVGTYKLYANDQGLFYIADSFDNLSSVDNQPNLYTNDRCNVDLNEGTVVLPVESQSECKISQITIATSSNGTAGNNQELGQLQRNSLDKILDNDPTTWFEYEVVTEKQNKNSLILGLNIVLGEESIINNIQILSNNFMAKTYPVITFLQTSLDGNFFVDLIQDIPIHEDFLESKNEVLKLSPAAGKFSGVNSFSFKPRRAKYIRIRFQQDDSYQIQTATGYKWRKAIGLRDIHINSIRYKTKGQLASTQTITPDEVKEVALVHNANIFEPLCSVDSEISYDDHHWLTISPLSGVNKSEIITFNTVDSDTVTTDLPVNALRYRVTLTRNPNEFSSEDQVIISRQNESEFLTLSPTSGLLTPLKTPIVDSIRLYGVSYGQVGGLPFVLSLVSSYVRDGVRSILLPEAFKNKTLTNFNLYINKDLWTSTITLGSSPKTYTYDPVNNILHLVNAISASVSVGLSDRAELKFDRERLTFSYDDKPSATLNLSSDGIKSATKVYRLATDAPITTTITVAPRAKVLHTGLTDISTITFATSAQTVSVSYVDGYSELKTTGAYSVDKLNGTIYCASKTPNTVSMATITYSPRIPVTDFNVMGSVITISNVDYAAISSGIETIATSLANGFRAIALSHGSIEPKSLQFISTITMSTTVLAFNQEVGFIDGTQEFDLSVSTDIKSGLYSLDYKNGYIYKPTVIQGGNTIALSLQYRYTEYYAEYNIACLIPSTAYSFDYVNNQIKLSDAYIVDTTNKDLLNRNSRNMYRLDYDTVVTAHDNLKELEPYYTPFLRDYKLELLLKNNY